MSKNKILRKPLVSDTHPSIDIEDNDCIWWRSLIVKATSSEDSYMCYTDGTESLNDSFYTNTNNLFI